MRATPQRPTPHTAYRKAMSTLLRSIPCPECTPDDARERPQSTYGLWDAISYKNEKRCTNCGHVEPYHPKSPRDGTEHGTTRSQERKLDAMREWAAERALDGDYELRLEHSDFGPAMVTLILNPDSTFIRVHLLIFLSRRGKVEVKIFDSLSKSDAVLSMFLRATNGHDDRG